MAREMKKWYENESQNIEYKESWRDEYLKWICGFANAKGGRIFIGISDDKQVCGVENAKRLMEDIPNKVRDVLGIIVDVNLFEDKGLEYIEIVVEPSSVPISFKGQFHYRTGSTKQELKGISLQQFILKKMGKQWDDVVNETTGLDCISRESIDYFLKKGILSSRISENERNAETEVVLENLNLLDDDNHLKYAALLLFAKKPQKYFTGVEFKIGRFHTSESDLVFQDVVEGNIIEMADKVIDLLKSKYLTSPIRYEGLQRIEELEIPESALREIIYNAICHKDYTGASIQMHVYDDHLEVWNEGELPDGYTIETLMQKHSSRPRNKNIAYTMFKAGFIEAWGRGYSKIREEFEKKGLPMPTIENNCGGTLVTVLRPNYVVTLNSDSKRNEQENEQENEQDNISERQRIIIDLIREFPTISLEQMSKKTKVSISTIRRELKALSNIVKRVGSDKGGHWEIQR